MQMGRKNVWRKGENIAWKRRRMYIQASWMQQIVKILENPVYAQLGAELTDDCGNYKDSI